MTEPVDEAKGPPRVGAIEDVARQAIYGLGLVRPASAADLSVLGFAPQDALPELLVLATEHPNLPPPKLAVHPFHGEQILVLSWLEYDPMQGPLPEVAEITKGWAVHGNVRWLLARRVSSAAEMDAPPESTPGKPRDIAVQTLSVASGPGVSFEPSYIQRGAAGFFGQYGQPVPAGLADPSLCVAIRSTASGKGGARASSVDLPGGGVRVEVGVPIDPGLPIWGPRGGAELSVFASSSSGRVQWLLQLL